MQVAESSERLPDEPEARPASNAMCERSKARDGWSAANEAACNSALFELVALGSLVAKNRLVRAATYTGLAGKDGRVTPELARVCLQLARGGVGTIITGLASVVSDNLPYPRTLCMHSDALANDWRPLLDELHACDVRVVLQLVHAGSAIMAPQPGERAIGPSAVLNPKSGIVPEEATTAELHGIAQAFAAAAARAKAVGFDGVEVHAAHGYLLSQFLDPRLNQRTDCYGGSPERRTRFVVECVGAVREAVGEGFPVLVKLNSSDGAEDGLSEEESLACALRLIAHGATAIEASGAWRAAGQAARRASAGDASSADGGRAGAGDASGKRGSEAADTRNSGASASEPYFAEFALRLAAETDAPVILTGGCRSTASVERLAEKGIAAFGLGRPLICEPDLPQRWREDASYRPRCTSCDGCSRSAGCRCVLSED